MKERVLWLDFMKGIAIILVVVGHVLDGVFGQEMFQHSNWMRVLYNIIYSFHMPFFFMLSGIALSISNGQLGFKKLVRGGKSPHTVSNLVNSWLL